MKYTLRDYQSAASSRTVEFLLAQAQAKKPKSGVVYLPTGSGKSLVIGSASTALAQHPHGGSAVVFQPTKEILEQNLEKIESYGFRAGVVSASMNRRDFGDVTLATIGSVYKHPEWFEDFLFGLVDEGHLAGARDNAHIVSEAGDQFYHRELGLVTPVANQEGVRKGRVRVVDDDAVESEIPRPKKSMYKSFIEAVPHMRWAAFSASPYRLESNAMGSQLKVITRTRPRLWDTFIHWTQNKELFEKGYLAKLEYYPIKGFKRSKIEINSGGTDFDAQALQLHLWERNWETKNGSAIHFPDKLTEVVSRLLDAGRPHVLAFTASIRESEYLAEQLKGECAVVTGETKKADREAIFRDFRSGDVRVLSNVGVVIHGFDFPALATMVDAAPTMSLSRYYQKRGRIVRRDPENENKVGWVVDMVEGYQQFGKVEDLTLYCQGQTRWDIFGRPGGKEEKQLTSVYLAGAGLKGCCPKCHAPKQIAYYEAKGKWLPISAAPAGMRANLVIEQKDKKKICRLVERGDPEATHIFHFIACDRIKAAREAA